MYKAAMTEAFNWRCPYCDRDQAVTSQRHWELEYQIDIDTPTHGEVGIVCDAIVCANPDCEELTLVVALDHFTLVHGVGRVPENSKVVERRLLPESFARPIPEYVPQAIRDDYREACLIRDFSPKASATLSRRCLQGMIRDFGKVKPARLYDEISDLSAAVEQGTAPRDVSIDSIAALTAIRKIGNIGAHMEADVGLIVDVDSDEAQSLIDIIEVLLEEWHIERHKRTQRFSKIEAISDEKASLIAAAKEAAKSKLD